MKWHLDITFPVFNDAWHTWNTFYRKSTNPKIKLEQFMNKAAEGHYKILKLSYFKKDLIENLSTDRIQAKTITEAYPPNDRPRGIKDVQSVKYHMRTKKAISPIVIIKIKNKKGKIQGILLDGMHRLVAASLLKKQNIPTLFLNFI